VCGLAFKAPPFGYAVLGLLLIGLFFKGLALKLSEAWLRFAGILGVVNSKVLPTLINYLILIPVAVLYRRNTKDALQLNRPTDSHRLYWIVREHQFEARDLGRSW